MTAETTDMSSSWIRIEKRLAIYLRDEFTCLYCGKNLKNEDPENVTLDHLVPRNPLVAHGNGGNEATNLITACRACNCSRQDKPWVDFAPGGARDRIETRRYQTLNVKLAKSILSGEIADAVADVEALR